MKHQSREFFAHHEPVAVTPAGAGALGAGAVDEFSAAFRAHLAIPLALPSDTRPYARFGKRLFDIVFALLTAPFTLTVTLLAALALWLESGQPFYTQLRRGRDGKSFRIVKLRTMVRDADALLARVLEQNADLREEWETTQKLRHDPRITRVGSFLRRTSLDELPQFYNVLIGDMSVVGPRPMMPDQAALYGDLRHYDAMRPGVTGLWQVERRHDHLFSERVELDATYHNTISFRTDLQLVLRTISVVLRRKGY